MQVGGDRLAPTQFEVTLQPGKTQTPRVRPLIHSVHQRRHQQQRERCALRVRIAIGPHNTLLQPQVEFPRERAQRRPILRDFPFQVALDHGLGRRQLRPKPEILQRRRRIAAVQTESQPAGAVLTVESAIHLLGTVAQTQVSDIHDITAALDRRHATAQRVPLPDNVIHREHRRRPQRGNELGAGGERTAIRHIEPREMKLRRMAGIGHRRPMRRAHDVRRQQLQIGAGLRALGQHPHPGIPAPSHQHLARCEIGPNGRRRGFPSQLLPCRHVRRQLESIDPPFNQHHRLDGQHRGRRPQLHIAALNPPRRVATPR